MFLAISPLAGSMLVVIHSSPGVKAREITGFQYRPEFRPSGVFVVFQYGGVLHSNEQGCLQPTHYTDNPNLPETYQ